MFTITELSLSHPHYPPLLKHLAQVPEPLYYVGDVNVLTTPSVAIVGSRSMTRYGQQVCEQLVRDLVQHGLTIVSGLATGIDAIAHRTALQTGGKTIAVVANGLDLNDLFPAEHQKLAQQIVNQGGTLVSEYPPGTVARRYYFPARNRIIAALTLGTVVIEARQKSGALITAARALELNREVFAVPGSIFSSRSTGTNGLLKQGAKLIEQVEDIVTELNLTSLIQPNQKNTVHYTLSDTEQKIVDYLAAGAGTAELIIQNTAFSADEIALYLTELEIKGIVRRNLDYSYSLNQRL